MIFLALIFGYLLGAVPFGLVLTRLAGLGDIREVGSGNIGATNVLRTGRKDLALATLLLDSGKGAIAVLLTSYMTSHVGGAAALTPAANIPMAVAGAAAFLGHCFPVWLGFKGGKGVATFLGTLLALSFPVGLSVCALWLLAAFTTRISSLSALIAAALAPIILLFLDKPVLATAVFFMTVLIFYRHQENIHRILQGQEPKIGKK